MEPSNKLLIGMGHAIIWLFAIGNVVMIFLAHRWTYTNNPGDYSIFSSKGFYIAYHIWGIIVAGVCSWALWKKNRMLFLFSLLLLLVLMFYPWFTQNPPQIKQG